MFCCWFKAPYTLTGGDLHLCACSSRSVSTGYTWMLKPSCYRPTQVLCYQTLFPMPVPYYNSKFALALAVVLGRHQRLRLSAVNARYKPGEVNN